MRKKSLQEQVRFIRTECVGCGFHGVSMSDKDLGVCPMCDQSNLIAEGTDHIFLEGVAK